MGLKRILLAAAVGAAVIAVPVGAASAAGEVVPGVSSIASGPTITDGSSGWIAATYVNANPTTIYLGYATYAGCTTVRIYDAAGTLLTPTPVSTGVNAGVPAGGSARVVVGCLSTGTQTIYTDWYATSDGKHLSDYIGYNDLVTATITGGSPEATLALAGVTGDSGAKDGTVTLQACRPANANPDDIDWVYLQGGIALPTGLSGCANVTFRGLTYGDDWVASLSTDYAKTAPVLAVTVPFTPKALSVPGAPVISGNTKVMSTVKVTGLTFSPKPSAVVYQWFRNGKAIGGANSVSYRIQQADYNKRLAVSATALVDGRKVTKSTSSNSLVTAGPKLPRIAAPAQSGTATVGKKLAVSKGTWNASGVKAKYQWLRGGKAIAKATGSSYKLTAADKGKRVSVKVTVTAKGFAQNTFTTKGSVVS